MLTLIQLVRTVPAVTKATLVILWSLTGWGPGSVTIPLSECPSAEAQQAYAKYVAEEVGRRKGAAVQVFSWSCRETDEPVQPSA